MNPEENGYELSHEAKIEAFQKEIAPIIEALKGAKAIFSAGYSPNPSDHSPTYEERKRAEINWNEAYAQFITNAAILFQTYWRRASLGRTSEDLRRYSIKTRTPGNHLE